MEDIGFYFEYDGLVLQLPINPEEVSVEYKGNTKSAEIINLGEISILKRKKLANLSFDCFFPEQTWFPGIRTLGEFKKPEFYRDFFLNLMELGKPARLIITGININMLVSIETFTPRHQSGDFEDEYYSLSLKEYRTYGIKSYTLAADGTTAVSATTTRDVTSITVGCTVSITGAVYTTSDAIKVSQSVSKVTGKVAYIASNELAAYYISIDRVALGWVKKESVSL